MMKQLLIFLLLPCVMHAQVDSTDLIIEQMIKQQRITGMSIAIIKDGKVLLNKGYGLAEVEQQVPANSNTVYRLCSVSKQFFTTAILKLQEEGKLSIEDQVHRFFPDAPETWRPIQVKHLMSHTSGLVRESPAYDNFKIITDLEMIRAAYNQPLNFKTGEKYQYCNLAYYMLAEIITQVSGQHWNKYIHEKLFLPAGMTNTYMTDFYEVIPNRASGYFHKKDTLLNATSMFAVRPSGGFLSTTSDMIKWDKVLDQKKIILNKDNWEQLWKPVVKTSANEKSKSYYGYGWELDEMRGHKLIAHGGSNMGFRSFYVRFVDDRLSIIVLTNTDEAEPASIAMRLARYYFKSY